MTTRDVHSRSYDVLEGIFLGIPTLLVVAMVGATALSLTGTSPFVGLAVVWVLSIPIGLLLAVVAPVLLYFDANELAEHDLDWKPSPGLYAIFGFLFSGLTVLHYLYKRQEFIRDEATENRWWLLAVGGIIASLLSTLVASSFQVSAFFSATFAFILLFPIGVYKDAEYVRTAEAGWSPNPTMQFTMALVSNIIPALGGIVYLGYYLYKRYTSVGLP